MDKRILIIDNDLRLLASLGRYLRMNGYHVFTANCSKEALSILHKNRAHLAVIDVRLNDDDDSDDKSGLELAKKLANLDNNMVRLFLTGYRRTDTVLDILSPDDRDGTELGEIVMFKDEHPADWLAKINRTFARKVHVNFGLDLRSHSDMPLDKCLSLLNEPGLLSSRVRIRFLEEIEELFRRLFLKETKIELLAMSQGLSTAALICVKPEHSYGPENLVVVKIDIRSDALHFKPQVKRRKSIYQEKSNYDQFVFRRIGGNRTTSLEFFAQTSNFEGIVYSFLGGSVDRLITFDKYYTSENKNHNIEQLIHNLFDNVLDNWFKSRVEPCQTSLGAFYLNHLSLNRPGKRDALLMNIHRILQAPEVVDQVLVEFIDDQRVTIEFAGLNKITLPNPIDYAYALAEQDTIGARQLICHGDLNGSNMLVDETNYPRLIDFAQSGPAPVYTDFAKLESVIKFELLQSQDLQQLCDLERCLIRYFHPIGHFPEPELNKAIAAIAAIRQELQKRATTEEMSGYEVALLYNTLKRVGWPASTSVADDDTNAFSHVHAFLAAALLAGKLSGTADPMALSPSQGVCCPSRPAHTVSRPDPLFLRQLHEGRVGLFIGAGLSIGSGLPSWRQLFGHLLADLGLNDDGSNYPDIAQLYVDHYGSRLPIVQYVVQSLEQSGVAPNKDHYLLSQLPFRAIVTTNYDNLLEEVFPKSQYRPISSDDELSISDHRFPLMYLHGKIGGGQQMVITSSDYNNYDDSCRNMTRKLQQLLQDYSFLFVGYSFSDPNLHKLLEHVSKVHGELRQVHFALMLHEDRVLFNRMRNLGIQPIDLAVKDIDCPVELTAYLQQLIDNYKPQVIR